MRKKGWSFYHRLTPNMLVVDRFGRVHIADDVLLRRASPFSHSLDIAFAADTLETLLTLGRHLYLEYPLEVIHLLNLMRSPSAQPEYMMLIHPAGMQHHQRQLAYLKAFDLVIEGTPKNIQWSVLHFIWRGCLGWGTIVEQSLLLNLYYRFPVAGRYHPDDARDCMHFLRSADSHVFSKWEKLLFYGFPYSREDHQFLVDSKLGLLTCFIQSALWSGFGFNSGIGRELLKRLKPEDHFCKAGFCCPVGACLRANCYDREVKRAMDTEMIKGVIRVTNLIRSGTSDEMNIPARYTSNFHRRPAVTPQVDDVIVGFIATMDCELTVRAGDTVELLYEPEDCFSEKILWRRWCYVRSLVPAEHGKTGLIPLYCLKKYTYLYPPPFETRMFHAN
ncbi:uncharacterized protein LOC119275565 [Triticum dicoccoides]|uniref:uncharacterized protein LOC119275565 n=1 Tax=Triticum dicoccoides TaxID=85692 RepID=UPI00188DDCB6|nr:uncharacterized protein LOC119275565 [Triticum dicoccoides]